MPSIVAGEHNDVAGFLMLFGVSDERLHDVMVSGFAAVLALQILVTVAPEPFGHIVGGFRG